jgi:hypothetical protein
MSKNDSFYLKINLIVNPTTITAGVGILVKVKFLMAKRFGGAGRIQIRFNRVLA